MIEHNFKKLFPIYNQYPELIFLDNGATTHKPKILMDSIVEYYSKMNSNVGRGSYFLAQKSDDVYYNSKEIISNFFNVSKNNTIITSGATESSNLAVNLIKQKVVKGKIVVSFLEHHANFLPLQRLAKENNLEFIVINDLEILSNPSILPSSFWIDVKVLALTHVSNTTGRILPIKEWVDLAKKYNVISIIDGSQAVSTLNIDVKGINPDFYYFSAHKVYGPMGLGILFISDKFLELDPLKLGGGIVDYVTKENYILSQGIQKFEAGTPNVADTYAFAQTLDFLSSLKNNLNHQYKLSQYAFEEILKIESNSYKIKVLDSTDRKHNPNLFSSLFSFIVLNKNVNERGLHSHDIGSYLTENDICVRFGQHCAHPLHQEYNVSSTIRVSLALYNNKSDIDKFLTTLKEGINRFDAL